MRPLTTVRPPERFRHTYTGPVGTSRRRTSRARACRRRRAAAAREDDERFLDVRVVLVELFVVCVFVCGTVDAASSPSPPPPPVWPSRYSEPTSSTTTASTAQPRPEPIRRRRRDSRALGGRIGCISTSDSRSWPSLYSSMSSLPSSPSASAYVRRKLLT